jgi:hypothetical protein
MYLNLVSALNVFSIDRFRPLQSVRTLIEILADVVEDNIASHNRKILLKSRDCGPKNQEKKKAQGAHCA